MRIAGLLLALIIIVVSAGGIFATGSAIAFRRFYFATPATFWAAGVVRLLMGILLIRAAASSRSPRILRALGAVMCLQALAANLFGIDRARTIMEWETMQGTAVLRAGALVSLAAGCFIAFAFMKRPSVQTPAIRN